MVFGDTPQVEADGAGGEAGVLLGGVSAPAEVEWNELALHRHLR